MRNWRLSNPDKVAEISKKWQVKNKTYLAEYLAKKIHCDVCNKEINWTYKARHEATKAHIKNVIQQLTA